MSRWLGLVVALLCSITLSLLWGANIGEGQTLLIEMIRAPRVMAALLVGMALAVSGTLLQAYSRNDLADPGLLGINAGASLAVVLMLAFLPQALSLYWAPSLAAFVGAATIALLTQRLATRDGRTDPITLVLTGVALSLGASALTLFAAQLSDAELYNQAAEWLAGSLTDAHWLQVGLLLPVLPLCLLAWFLAGATNLLQLSEEASIGLGLPLQRFRLGLLLLATMLAALAVSVAGAIAFVGLLIPHLARMLFGANLVRQLPAAMLMGGTTLVLADFLARTLLFPLEVPVGLLLILFGAPYFIVILLRRAG